MGALITDYMRAHAGSEVAITNAGGLRADLPAGPLDRGHALDAFPFINHAVTLALKGRDLQAVLEHGFSLKAGMVQASGLRAVYDLARPSGARLVELQIGGHPVEPERIYRVTTNSFLAEGGDGYLAFKHGQEISRGSLLSDLLVSSIQAHPNIELPALGRLVRG